MGIYKKALFNYIDLFEEETAEVLFWKFMKEHLNKNNTEECSVLVDCLVKAMENEN